MKLRLHIPDKSQPDKARQASPAFRQIGESGSRIFLNGDVDMGKGTGSVSIIGGADGPTSIFIAGKGGRVKLTTHIQNYFRIIKRNRVKKRITPIPIHWRKSWN